MISKFFNKVVSVFRRRLVRFLLWGAVALIGLEAVAAGATSVIQPGGSIRDAEVIAAADEQGIAMAFTGTRVFRH